MPADDPSLDDLLARVARGEVSPAAAREAIQRSLVHDLGHAAVDLGRAARRGRPEAIFGEGKSSAQVAAIARSLLDAGQNVLVTRIGAGHAAEVLDYLTGTDQHRQAHHDATSRLLRIEPHPVPRKPGTVLVISAGTIDIPAAEEAAQTAEFYGSPVVRRFDVGVAGIHRLLAAADLLRSARVIVVAAGMDGALPGVVAGLSPAPVIALPTSRGYGASFAGVTALLTSLNACAPGVSVVNIDNGFGAGYLADVINGIGASP